MSGNFDRNVELGWLWLALIVLVFCLLLFSDYLGLWSGIFIGLFVSMNIRAWSRRWYIDADHKWYRTW